MIDLTADSDVEAPEIDHTTTLRANILRGFFDRSQSKSPMKHPSPSTQKSPQQGFSFLDMIRARRGFPVANKPPEDTGAGDAVEEAEEDASSNKTHESSMTDADVGFLLCFNFPTTYFFVQG